MEQPLKSQVKKLDEEICIPYHISRTFVQQNRQLTFLYGNDINHRGIMGQAWSFGGETNAFEVPVLVKYCPSSKVYFNDSDFKYLSSIILEWLSKVPKDKPIIPCPKLGEGCSRLKELCPSLFLFVKNEIDKIKYSNIKFIFK